MTKLLNKLFKPDGKNLTTLINGQAGSGKSYFLKNTLQAFSKQWGDPHGRIVYICPKQEMVLGDPEETMTTTQGLEKHLRKNKIAVVYPDPTFVEADVDEMISTLFDIREANPDFKCVVIVDDSQTFVPPGGRVSPEFSRLSLTGRSKHIRFVSVTHRMVFNRSLEGSVSYLVTFTLPLPKEMEDAKKRYGFDASDHLEFLTDPDNPYRFVWFDVTRRSSQRYAPIDVKGESKTESDKTVTPEVQ